MVARDVCMVARGDMLMSILKVEALHVMTCYLSYSEVFFKALTLLVNIIYYTSICTYTTNPKVPTKP